MIKLLFYFALILAGLIVGPTLVQNKGYVMVALGDYTVETSVVGAVLVLVLVLAGLQLLEWVVIKLLGLAGNTLTLPRRWRRRKARENTLTGILALAEQDWHKAENAMVKGAKAGEQPVLNYLAAARAAHHRGDFQASESYLDKAESLPGAATTVQITRIRYQLDHGELEAAQVGFDALPSRVRNKPQVLKLAQDLYRKQEDWPALTRLLPALSKHKILAEDELAQLPVTIEAGGLRTSTDLTALEQRWKGLSRRLKGTDEVFAAYALALGEFGESGKARKLILQRLDKQVPQPELLALLPRVAGDATESLMSILERRYPESDSVALMDCRADLGEKIQLWQQVKDWRQQAALVAPNAERYRALARVQEQLGEQTDALQSYREILALPQPTS